MMTSIAIETECVSSTTLEGESQLPSETFVDPVSKFDIPLSDEHVVNDLLLVLTKLMSNDNQG